MSPQEGSDADVASLDRADVGASKADRAAEGSRTHAENEDEHGPGN